MPDEVCSIPQMLLNKIKETVREELCCVLEILHGPDNEKSGNIK